MTPVAPKVDTTYSPVHASTPSAFVGSPNRRALRRRVATQPLGNESQAATPNAPGTRRSATLLRQIKTGWDGLSFSGKVILAPVAVALLPFTLVALAVLLLLDRWANSEANDGAASADTAATIPPAPVPALPLISAAAAPGPLFALGPVVTPLPVVAPAAPFGALLRFPPAPRTSLPMVSYTGVPAAGDWHMVALRSGDRFAAYISEHARGWDVDTVQAMARHGGFLWRDLCGARQDTATLAAMSQQRFASDPAGACRDAASLVWHFMGHAVEEQKGFTEGSFSCADPEGRLRAWLSGMGYKRISSHIQHDNSGLTFGIDIRGNTWGLPAGHRHILCKEFCGPDGSMRLLVKPEAWGTQGVVAFVGHGVHYAASKLRKISSFFGSDEGPGMRKERIPRELVEEYGWFIEGLDGARANMRQVGQSGRGEGLAAMTRYLNEQLQVPGLPLARRQLLQALLGRLQKAFDHLDVRIGNEVIIPLVQIEELETLQH